MKKDYEYVILSIIPEYGTDQSRFLNFKLWPEYENNLRILFFSTRSDNLYCMRGLMNSR